MPGRPLFAALQEYAQRANRLKSWPPVATFIHYSFVSEFAVHLCPKFFNFYKVRDGQRSAVVAFDLGRILSELAHPRNRRAESTGMTRLWIEIAKLGLATFAFCDEGELVLCRWCRLCRWMACIYVDLPVLFAGVLRVQADAVQFSRRLWHAGLGRVKRSGNASSSVYVSHSWAVVSVVSSRNWWLIAGKMPPPRFIVNHTSESPRNYFMLEGRSVARLLIERHKLHEYFWQSSCFTSRPV